MDATKWTQGFQENIGLVKPMEEIGPNACTNNNKPMLERKTRPQEQLNCPRCNSNNTKFCYYNNYSLTQPRYFCKTCRRYWTEGGSLRNVPVGGGSRKNKRSVTSSSSSFTSSSNKLPDLNPSFSQFANPQNPNKTQNKGQDLNLSFQVMHDTDHHHNHEHISQYAPEVSKAENNENSNNNNSCLTSYSPNSSQLSGLDLLRSSVIASRGLNSFVPAMVHNIPADDSTTNSMFSTGFPLQDMKPNLGFSIDGLGNRFGSVHGVHQENLNGGKLFFPFGDHHMKHISSTTSTNEVDQNKEQGNSGGYWSGMIGGGGSW